MDTNGVRAEVEMPPSARAMSMEPGGGAGGDVRVAEQTGGFFKRRLDKFTERCRQRPRRGVEWLQEASGAVGDLGTFVPITVALTLVNGLDLGTTLIYTGICNVLTGLLFGVPMPVQPMKSIASVALTQGLSIPEIMAAGVATAATLFLLGVTRLMFLVHHLMPLPVVRGIQLSQGLAFAITAVKYIRKDQNFSKNKSLGNRQWLGLDGQLLAIFCFCFIVLVSGSGDGLLFPVDRQKRKAGSTFLEDHTEGHASRKRSHIRYKFRWVPTAMVVFALGIVLAFIRRPGIAKHLRLGPSTPHVVRISAHDWKTGFVQAAVPQIPLSVLNSVVAVCKLSHDLFPERQAQVTPTFVSTSVGLMNLVGCWFGAMPVCHGAGGLAGQWRFGARSGMAVVMLGTSKILLGLLLGNSLVKVLEGYPVGILGVLLLYAGVELAMCVRDMTQRAQSFVVLTAAAISISSNASLGFVASLVIHVLLTLPDMNCNDIGQYISFIASHFPCYRRSKPQPQEEQRREEWNMLPASNMLPA
ncbi:hypothetical protein KP509_38G055500 [Ceratopteris richardii]|uniref:Molybdate transporter 1 n=1 Tax=Ceratopteris richardii TaxID=49495 RepID=A0A8T2Q624_CERRI|nr:hypothetical protein KP509_38G055500 [Ceratopteris richardii]